MEIFFWAFITFKIIAIETSIIFIHLFLIDVAQLVIVLIQNTVYYYIA